VSVVRCATVVEAGCCVYISLILGSLTANKIIRLTVVPKNIAKKKGYGGLTP